MNFYKFEDEYYDKGYKNICGIDEVGRGCLFGDVVSCAIIMPRDEYIDGVDDSKKLTPKKREELYTKILESCIAVGIGRASADIIDKVNIKMATHISMINALENLRDKENKKVNADCVLIDAETIETGIFQHAIIKGDESCYSIACASIIAKVYRDDLCNKWAEEYPHYGIEKHKGYATKYHRDALKAYGPTDMHRKSFLKNMKLW
ncbi:MAG: ribonuclease HII [Peptoniphilus sp.]|uniref:ribonuclease HII n=1 Tax=Peptoniphilus sp. TaxID=1971214 RepID=UPI0025E68B8A|nr:ribonuclease HII [Peptoniphilus sp.]MCI5642585.1 ribonuclease HII [Peptoniphilus sp.]MDD7352423.1 ribonuclease HII [Peptoniphilaceae bacterium]MDY3902643.1 ribonuclease HII [Peptoniphilus sp.]